MLTALAIDERFEILATVGTGGMGTVHRALDRATGSTVALKVLMDWGSEAVARFEGEARALGDMEHPHVVRYVAHGTLASGAPYLAMEWLDGLSLSERLKQGPLDVDDVVELGKRVSSALAVAHERGYVHRDIKPSNLFLPHGDVHQVKLLDFGIARVENVAEAITKTGVLIGTPGYMAPEQAKGERGGIDARADIFSLGTVIFECLAGRPAFQGVHLMALLAKLLMEDPVRLREVRPSVPFALDELVHRMLSKDPQHRPADGRALLTALERVGVADSMAGAGSAAGPDALTHTEKRLVSVVAVIPSLAERVQESGVTLGSAPIPGQLLADMRRAVQPFGARIEEIANGVLLALLVGTGPATDQAAVAARCALRMQLLLPRSPIVLLTGRGENTGKLPIGEVFERAASRLDLVKEAPDTAGFICIDEITQALLDGRFDVVEEKRAIVLRGERTTGTEVRTLLGQESPFVGRDRELRTLLDFVEEALGEPRAGVMLVTAEAGGGKSRLRHEFLQRVRAAHPELSITIGRGESLGAGSAFALLGAAFRGALGLTADAPMDDRRNKIAAMVERYFQGDDLWRISGFLGEMIETPFADDHDPRVRAAHQNPSVMADQIETAYVDLLHKATEQDPQLLILEDLHWGDGPSVKLIGAALRELSDKPFLIVAFARPEVHEVFPRLWSGLGVQSLALSGLPRRGAEMLVKTMLGAAADPETVTNIVQRANGNAFYLEELIRAVRNGRKGTLPESVLGMVEARIGELDPEARRILRAASVFGETFWMGGLQALLRDEFSVAGSEQIKQLCQLELIAPRQTSRFSSEVEYGFRHALVREGAYAMLTNKDRASGHALAGEWLEQMGEQDSMVLAEHFERGNLLVKAAGAYSKAAQQAMRGADFPAAMARARKGIACAAEGPTKVSLYEVLVFVYFLTAQYALCFEAGTVVLDETAKEGRIHAHALGLVAVSALFLGKFESFGPLVPQLLSVTPGPDDVGMLAQAFYGVFVTLIIAGQRDFARPHFFRQQELTAPYRDNDLLAAGWSDFARVFAFRELDDDPWSARESNRAAAHLFERAGAREMLAITNAHFGLSNLQLGDYAVAEELLHRVIANPDSGMLAQTYASYFRCLLLAETRRYNEALVAAGELAQNALKGNDFMMLWCGRLLMADVFATQDKLAEADGVLDELGEANAFLPFLKARFLSIRSEIRRRQGQKEEAVRLAAESVAVGQAGPPYNYGRMPFELRYALALDSHGDISAARKVLQEARDALLTRAAKIPDENARCRYLENIDSHAKIMTLANEWLRD